MEVWKKVSRMPAKAIRNMQDDLLQKMVKNEFAKRHPYYREIFKEKGIDPESFRSLDDLNKLPLTKKEDMLPREDDLRHPKKFVLEPPSEEEQKSKKKGFALFGKKEEGPDPKDYKFHTLYFSAGRTARPLPVEYTHYDLNNMKEAGFRAFDILGLTRDDTMVNAFTYAPNVYFWQMFYSTVGIGSTALQAGGGKVLGMEKILKAMDNMEAEVIAAAPGYAMFALQTLDFFGFSAENLQRLVIGIDYAPVSATEKMKKLMESVGAKDNKVQRIYFNSEAKCGWAECEPGYGYHLNPDHVLVEILDPDGETVLGEGEKGEVVLTHLDAKGTTVLRYRTGDIATGGLVTEPCPNCKRTVPRLMGDIERKSHYYKLSGNEGPVDFNANELRRRMMANADVLLWYVEINRQNGTDGLKIVFKGVSGRDEEALQKNLEQEISETFNLPVTVEKNTLDAIANKIGLEKYITEEVVFDTRQE